MKTFKGKFYDFKLTTPKESVVVIGYFDGVHRYHQDLLSRASEIARNNHLNLIVVTFSKKIGSPQQGFDLMTENTKKNYLANHYPIDDYLILDVDASLISLSPEAFIEWLKKDLKSVKVVEGADFRFGQFAKGNIATLQKAFGIENVIVLPRENNVSSTKIREQLLNGDLNQVLENLGHELVIEIDKQVKDNFVKYSWIAPQIPLAPGKYQLETAQGQKIILDYQSPTHFNFSPKDFNFNILYLKKQT